MFQAVSSTILISGVTLIHGVLSSRTDQSVGVIMIYRVLSGCTEFSSGFPVVYVSCFKYFYRIYCSLSVGVICCGLSHCSTPGGCSFYCEGELSTPPHPVGSSNCLSK